MNNSKFLKTAILLCFCSTFISFSNRSINDDQISPLTGLLKCETYAKGFTINYYYNIKRQLLKTQTQYGQITSYDYYDNFIVSKKILSFVNTQYIDTLFYNSAGLIGYRNIYSYSPQENKYYFFSKSRYFYNKDNNLIEWRNIMMDRYHDSTTQIFQYTIEKWKCYK